MEEKYEWIKPHYAHELVFFFLFILLWMQGSWVFFYWVDYQITCSNSVELVWGLLNDITDYWYLNWYWFWVGGHFVQKLVKMLVLCLISGHHSSRLNTCSSWPAIPVARYKWQLLFYNTVLLSSPILAVHVCQSEHTPQPPPSKKTNPHSAYTTV